MINQAELTVDQGLLAQVLALPALDPGVRHSNQGGWHSAPYYNIPSWFQPWADEIKKTVGFDIHNFWFNINGPGHSNRWHTHGQQYAATGVWYLQTPKNSGLYQTRIQSIEPWPGLLLWHAGGIDHQVTENLSPYSRISVAFNFVKQ